MSRKLIFFSIWIGFVIYAFFLSPPDQSNTFELIKNLSIGEWQGINPFVISIYYLMGVWPLIYSAVMFIDGRGQKIPAWPFAIASFAVGGFAILPYLALRTTNQQFVGKKNLLLKILDSRVTGMLLTVAAAILIAYGLQGDWGDFVQQWKSTRFIHVMSLDFCLLSLVFPVLLIDDMARRGSQNSQLFWFTTLIPLFGPLIYLCVRPSLLEVDVETIAVQPEME